MNKTTAFIIGLLGTVAGISISAGLPARPLASAKQTHRPAMAVRPIKLG
jgi:hypothetical protein